MEKENVATAGNLVFAAALTFAIPALQYLVNGISLSSKFAGSATSIFVILCISLWNLKTRVLSIRPVSPRWKRFISFLFIVVLILLLANLPNRPVSNITGQARSAFEVLDIIVLLPLAEELVFRGFLWSLLERLVKGHSGHIFLLSGTSLLFGLQHLGYWAQSSWPLPVWAYFHAISMVFAGIFFGFFKLKSGSFAVPAVLHMFANGAIILLQ